MKYLITLLFLFLSLNAFAERDSVRKIRAALVKLKSTQSNECGLNEECIKEFDLYKLGRRRKLQQRYFAEITQGAEDEEGVVIAEEKCVASFTKMLERDNQNVSGSTCVEVTAEWFAWLPVKKELKCIDDQQKHFDKKGWSYNGDESCEELEFARQENEEAEQGSGSGSGSGGQ